MIKHGKPKIFDYGKMPKILKITALAFSGILLLWFTFDMTGLKLGDTKIVTSAFADEPIDFLFYLIFIACIVCFILKDKIGKYALPGFFLLWGAFQLSLYFSSGDGIASYNKMFADTHHIIAASSDILVKDTYHIFLDIFILLAFVSAITFSVVKVVLDKRQKNQTQSSSDCSD